MESVNVVVRVRPQSDGETTTVVDCDTENQVITIADGRGGTGKRCCYDAIFAPDSNTQSIFHGHVASLAEAALEGYNGTVLAYGQTGSGKSFTMYGGGDGSQVDGIVACAIDHIFGHIEKLPEETRTLVRCSFLEIYKEEIRDLLRSSGQQRGNNGRPSSGLRLKLDASNLSVADGLSCERVRDRERCRALMERGLKHRQQASTKMNNHSSRSHAIFTLTVEVCQTIDGVEKVTIGKLNFVDLAGSERQSKTGTAADKDRQDEAIRINQSLTTLGRIIKILAEGNGGHVPYRESKLTRLLEDSLGGNAKTVMICCISPDAYNREESMNTLDYASRAKKIKNKPVVNVDPKQSQLFQYIERVRQLEEQLAQGRDSGVKAGGDGDATRDELHRQYLDEIRQLKEKQEETFRQFEFNMKRASEEEKRQLIKEKDAELQLIQSELKQRHLQESQRIEEEKAEELRRSEERFGCVLQQEKQKIQDACEVELQRIREAADRKLKKEREQLEQQTTELKRLKECELANMRRSWEREKEEEMRKLRELHARSANSIRESMRSAKNENIDRRFKELEEQLHSEKKAEIERLRQEHQDEVDGFTRQIAELKRHSDSQLIDDYQNEIRWLRQENQKLAMEIESGISNRDVGRENVEDDLRSEMKILGAKYESRIRQLEQQCRQLEKSRDTLQERLQRQEQEFNSELERFETNNQELRDSAINWKAKCTSLREELGHAQEELSGVKVERDCAKATLAEFENNHTGCEELLEDKEQKIKEQQREIQSLIKRCERARSVASQPTDRQHFSSNGSGSLTFRKDAARQRKSEVESVPSVFQNGDPRLPVNILRPQRIGRKQSPSPYSLARRRAVIDAVDEVRAESVVQQTRENYEKELHHYRSVIQRKDCEIDSLRQQLDLTADEPELYPEPLVFTNQPRRASSRCSSRTVASRKAPLAPHQHTSIDDSDTDDVLTSDYLGTDEQEEDHWRNPEPPLIANSVAHRRSRLASTGQAHSRCPVSRAYSRDVG